MDSRIELVQHGYVLGSALGSTGINDCDWRKIYITRGYGMMEMDKLAGLTIFGWTRRLIPLSVTTDLLN